jgi:iron complex outermembrane receptor protein
VGEDEFIGKNAGQTQHQGLELDVSYNFYIAPKMMLSPYFSYTLSDHSFTEFLDRDNDYSGNPLTGVPRNRLNSGLTLSQQNGLQFLLTHQYVDEIPLTDANSIQSEAYNLLNLQLRYQYTLATKFILDLNIGLNNVFDTNYAQSVLINAVGFGGAAPRYFYPGNGRNYYAGIQLSYSL